ncbi:alpha-L-rhamnosidase-related protein [Nocardia sp. NPDC004123]
MATTRDTWIGQWIWSDRPALGGASRAQPYGSLDPSRFDQRVLFRRGFELASVPARATVRITADSRYRLYVNGIDIGVGPVRHGPRQLCFDEYDIRHALREGGNTVAVLARFYGYSVPWWEPSPPSFTMGGGAMVAEIRLDEEIIATDPSWRFAPGDAWRPGHPTDMLLTQLPENLDARLLEPRWMAPDFDDSSWSYARVLAEYSVVGPRGVTRPPTEPWGVLRPRPIPALTGEIRTATVMDKRAAPPSGDDPRAALVAALGGVAGDRALLVADFAMIVSGRLELHFEAARGQVIDGALVEVPTVAALDSAPVFRYVARGSADTYFSADSVGGRYLVLALEDATTPVALRIRELLRPRDPVAPFDSSDPRLDAVYRTGLRTVDLTSHDAYIDCPTREQRSWTGDAVVHQSVDLIANQDWRLARWNPQLAAQPRADGLLPMVVAGDFATTQVPTIPDWSLHWIRSVHNLFRYTGDRELVGGLLSAAEGILRYFEPYCGPAGLVEEVPGWVLIDWSPVQVSGASAALNALLARGLRDFAEMARWVGDHGRATWAAAFHDRLLRGFESFWDPGRRAYRDNLVVGRRGTSVSEHVAAAAVCADLVPPERKPEILRLLLDRSAMFTASPLADHGGDALGPSAGQPVSVRPEPDWDTERSVVGAQPFFRYVVHDAIARLGAADRIVELCLDWDRLRADAPTAFRECWEGGSYCHGWSATPTRDLVCYTLGITPAEPGFTRARIAPRPGVLTAAAGAAPTPYGVVSVEIDGNRVVVDSPVPVEIVDRSGTATPHAAGKFSARF